MSDTPAIDRALADIDKLLADKHIDRHMAQRGRDLVGLLFNKDTVYALIAPDDGGLTFYWVGGRCSIEIDLYENHGVWACVRLAHGKRIVYQCQGLPRELQGHLRDFSDMVQQANPKWREMER